jgi:hypothetical protein
METQYFNSDVFMLGAVLLLRLAHGSLSAAQRADPSTVDIMTDTGAPHRSSHAVLQAAWQLRAIVMAEYMLHVL